jgi:BolA protein
MDTKERIAQALTSALSPQSLDVIDESHLHKGHAGHRPEGETHFRVKITAEAFRGRSRVDIHRMVNSILAEEPAAGVHALAIQAKAPE